MSLPIARARRKKVPSIQRSPNSSTRSHSRTESSKPSVVMSQASWSSPTSHSSLTSRSSEATRARSSSRRWPSSRRLRADSGLVEGRGRSSTWRHLEAERVGDLAQRRAAAGPQLAVLPVAEELVGVARRARPGVEDGLAVVDDQHGVAGLVAGEVGVRGVGAEAVVGVVGAHLEGAGRQHEPLARERLGEPRAARCGARRRPGAAGGRARGRPSPVRMKAAYAAGTAGSWDSVPAARLVSGGDVGSVGARSLTRVTVRRGGHGLAEAPPARLPRHARDAVATASRFTVVVTVARCCSAPLVMAAASLALSGAPGTLALATLLAALPVGPLVGCYLWLDRYEPEPRVAAGRPACCGAPSSRPPPRCVFQGIGGSSGGATDERQPGRRRAGDRGGRPRASSSCCCCGGAATSSTASSTASSTPAWSASASRSPRTSSTSPAAYNGTDGLGPGGTEALTGDLRPALPLQPVRAPALHLLHRHRRRPRGGVAQPGCRGSCAPLARLRRRGAARTRSGTARRLDGTEQLLRRLRHADAARPSSAVVAFALYRRRSERRDADRRARRRRPPRAASRPPTSRGSSTSAPAGAPAPTPGRRGGAARRSARCGSTSSRRSSSAFLHHRYLRGTAPRDFAARGQEHVDAARRRPAPTSPSPDRWYPPDD